MAYKNKLVAECLQHEPAFCTAACPFNLDVRDFIGKLQQGRLNAAYRIYRDTVGFPGIVTALCPEPCRQVCALKDAGGSVSLRMLEKSVIDHARRTDPEQYNMPPKGRSVAVIGGGISGLACALRLASKKYTVTVFEKSDRPGGHLHELPDHDLFMTDIKKQFKYENYSLLLNSEIKTIENLNFDAFYIATGRGGTDFGMPAGGKETYIYNGKAVFSGGYVTGADTMNAIAQGLIASTDIEIFLKTGRISHSEPPEKTKLTYDAVRVTASEPVLPANGMAFTAEEAVAEAKRCLTCKCDACVHYSPLMSYFRKFPERITGEVEVTINPGTLDGAGTVATRLIAACNHCGLCKEVCPKDIDTGEFLLMSHRAMNEKGAMPWAFHEFYLRDMNFSNEEAALIKLPPGFDHCRYIFFPGCQLGASDPRYVVRSYKFLIDHFPDTALMLQCCGAPAEWAGEEKLHSTVTEKIKTEWITLGRPAAIFACPTCKQMFHRYLPEIECRFIYSFIDDTGLKPLTSFDEVTASVFDPCASRYEPALQLTVRKLATEAGFRLEPLPMERRTAECCSYGGQVAVAQPQYANHTVRKRISRNDKPYITYCSNCHDIFATAGKKTWHILDVVFGIETEDREVPTVTQRRNNRVWLKNQMLKEFWKEDLNMKTPLNKLLISQQLREKLNSAMILETDLCKVIEHCEETGEKMSDPDKGTFCGHMLIGNMTYWVEYRLAGPGEYELINGYCHRMKIEE